MLGCSKTLLCVSAKGGTQVCITPHSHMPFTTGAGGATHTKAHTMPGADTPVPRCLGLATGLGTQQTKRAGAPAQTTHFFSTHATAPGFCSSTVNHPAEGACRSSSSENQSTTSPSSSSCVHAGEAHSSVLCLGRRVQMLNPNASTWRTRLDHLDLPWLQELPEARSCSLNPPIGMSCGQQTGITAFRTVLGGLPVRDARPTECWQQPSTTLSRGLRWKKAAEMVGIRPSMTEPFSTGGPKGGKAGVPPSLLPRQNQACTGLHCAAAQQLHRCTVFSSHPCRLFSARPPHTHVLKGW